MSNKPVNETALAVGGILAGWEIDPGWVPQAGDAITVSFDHGGGRGGQLPVLTTVALTVFHILAASVMRAGGKGLGSRIEEATSKASAALARRTPGAG